MGFPPSRKLIRSLRVTLQKMDEDFPSQADEPVVAGLKRLLLLRIAELEAASGDWANSADMPSEGIESDLVAAFAVGEIVRFILTRDVRQR